jgi:hypothetical protein
MTLSEVLKELRRRDDPAPTSMPFPEPADVAAMEAVLETQFHPDHRQLLLEASDVSVGPLEPATITCPSSHTHLPKVVAKSRRCGVPHDLFPICEDNADFYCLTKDGCVVFWSHNGWDGRSWANLARWIQDVWLADYD